MRTLTHVLIWLVVSLVLAGCNGKTIQEPTLPTVTRTPEPTLTPTIGVPCKSAKLIEDYPIVGGSDLFPGKEFTKTWLIKNTGSCAWTRDYEFVFFAGDQMASPAKRQLWNGVVLPGKTLRFSHYLKSPELTGEYQGHFKLRSWDGVIFGLGDSDEPLTVEISVVAKPDPWVDFTLEMVGSFICYEEGIPAYMYVVRVENTGVKELKYAYIDVYNLTQNYSLGQTSKSNPFIAEGEHCGLEPSFSLDPGEAGYLTFGFFLYSTVFRDHDWRFTARICDNTTPKKFQHSECISKELIFHQ